MTLEKSFSADRSPAALFLGSGVWFVTVGGLLINTIMPPVFPLVFIPIGGMAILAGASLFGEKIVVTKEGIKVRRSRLTIRWEEIREWSVEEEEAGRKTVCFQMLGTRCPEEISEQEVNRPGFLDFVTEIRRYVRPKEKRYWE